MRTIHILNGDALSSKFPSLIPGKKIIFRECLSDGPVGFQSFEELIQGRSTYLSETYPVTQKHPYIPYVSGQLEEIRTTSDTDGVFCWFEADLFCQINFWYTVYLLRNHTGDLGLILPVMDLRTGFSGLTEEQLFDAYQHPRILSKNERHIFRDLWILFQKNKVREAKSLARKLEPEFPFLLPAIIAWEDSIPNGSYLGKPKEELLAIANELKTNEFNSIFREFQQRLPIYGYGDLITWRLWKETIPKE